MEKKARQIIIKLAKDVKNRGYFYSFRLYSSMLNGIVTFRGENQAFLRIDKGGLER
jgi:hypothetical protein